VKVVSVAGTRPNFIKLAAVHRAVAGTLDHMIVNTGQHYDFEMSEIFFREFNLPQPDFDLGVGSGTACYQIGEMVKKLEGVLADSACDLVMVYGDTNSTLAGAISAAKLGIKLIHIESGLRSFDRGMPEEQNRVMTDHVADYLFAPTKTAVSNLLREGVSGKVIYVGDLAVELVEQVKKMPSCILDKIGLQPKSYVLFTLHRLENTRSKERLLSVIRAFEMMPDVQVVFPVHPRTLKVLNEWNLYSRLDRCKNVKLISPVAYVDFVSLLRNAFKLITDSGGAQKESYLLSVPCITIRDNTEWIETVEEGWNILAGVASDLIVRLTKKWQPLTIANSTSGLFGEGNTSILIRDFLVQLQDKQKQCIVMH
jgi:UDP-GlcNAc3NAcA epimerase